MSTPQEVEIKFFVSDLKALETRLGHAGFRCITPSTHEHNTLYDLPNAPLRTRGELLRLRKYGDTWKLTHKAKAKTGPHKSRAELETAISDGRQMDAILRALRYQPTFIYEKFRAEWSDGRGHVVLDHTPIGNIAEIEGEAAWIDETAAKLQVGKENYVTKSYAELFFDWKRRTGQKASNMTFEEIDGSAKPEHGESR